MKLKIRKMLFFHHINSIYSQSAQAALKTKVDRVLQTCSVYFLNNLLLFVLQYSILSEHQKMQER